MASFQFLLLRASCKVDGSPISVSGPYWDYTLLCHQYPFGFLIPCCKRVSRLGAGAFAATCECSSTVADGSDGSITGIEAIGDPRLGAAGCGGRLCRLWGVSIPDLVQLLFNHKY
mgnify:CR=1 FL=1